MPTRLSELWPELTRVAREEGVLHLGASGIQDSHAGLFAGWLDAGHHAGMRYLEKNRDIRLNPQGRFPWAQSAVVVLVPYASTRPGAPDGALSNHVSRYALGDDYHDVLDRILKRLEQVVGGKSWRYVDTGPLSDRALATQAGLGWIGKNAMLISEEHGSYFFIGTLLTSLENDVVPASVADRCGTCTRCIDACPTDAILPNRTVASQRCISYTTIEHRGPFDGDTELAGHVFGCDICQEVCPWNARAPEAHPAFAPRATYGATPVTDLLKMAQADFSALFRKSAIKRAKLEGMRRNADALRKSSRA